MEKSLFGSIGRGLSIAASAVALAGCAGGDGASSAAAPIEVAASLDTAARAEIVRWTLARRESVLAVDGLDAAGVTREHDEIALTAGRPGALSRAWFDASGRALGSVTAAPDAEPSTGAPDGVCGDCVRDTQAAVARLLAPPSSGLGTSAQALTVSPAAPPSEGLLLPPGGSRDTTFNNVQVEVTHNECWSCGGTSVTVCDYSVLGVCLWSHFECRSSGPASESCLRMRAAHQIS